MHAHSSRIEGACDCHDGGLLLLGLNPAAGYTQSLLEFYRHALQTNPSLRTREFAVEQAKAQEALATSKLLPQVSLSGNYYYNDYRESGAAVRRYDGMRHSVQARQALLDLASYFKLQGAHYSLMQAEQQQEAARGVLGGDVVDRYLMVLQANDDITHLRAEKEAVEGQLKRLRFMRERGLAKVTDLFETEAYYQGLLTKEIEAVNARAVALERLYETTGLASKLVAPLARERFPAVPGAAEQWVTEAAQNNPNVVALQKAIDAARLQIQSGQAEHAPQVALTASGTDSDQGYDNRLTPTHTVGTIGIQLTILLYEGGRVQATVRDATARYEMAREQLEGVRREIERDARTAYLDAASSYARIGSTNEEVRALERVLEGQRKYYELGATTIVDVLNAHRNLLKSRSDQSIARYDYIRALTTLRVRARSFSLRDIEEMDGWMARNTSIATSHPGQPAAPVAVLDRVSAAYRIEDSAFYAEMDARAASAASVTKAAAGQAKEDPAKAAD